MNEETKRVFDSLKGGLPNVKDEHKGGHRHSPPVIPDLDFEREATPVHDTIEYVDTTGPAPTPSHSIEHKLRELPEGWAKGAFDSHKGGVNIFNKGGKK